MNELSNPFGRNLRRLRTARNLSQKEVADAVGVQQAHIANIENGERRASLPLALTIAAHLGVTLDELSRDHEQPDATAAAA